MSLYLCLYEMQHMHYWTIYLNMKLKALVSENIFNFIVSWLREQVRIEITQADKINHMYFSNQN